MDIKSTNNEASSSRILLFSTAYLPYLGGAELALKEITKRITGIGFDLITARLDDGLLREEKIGNINIFRVGPKILYPGLAFLKALSLQNKNKYDAILALQASQGGGAAWLFKLFNPRVLFILNIQEGKDLKGQGFLINFFRKIIIRKADIITVISRYLAGYALKAGSKAKIVIIPNGVDLDRFKYKTKNAGRNLKIITVSRLVPKNGIEDLIQAFYILKTKYNMQNIELAIIGSGSLKENLKLKVNGLKLEKEVKFLGTIQNEELPGYLHGADVFVRPSLSEGLGTAFLEAMAAGVPIIGTEIGGIPDFLINGETGLYCKANDPADLAEKINSILSNEPLREKLIKNGRDMIEAKYNWENIAKEYGELLKNLTINHV